ncbi:hypothetical protein A2716_00070 [candidate division WWE3 bacterium RIFCSPHIGHO2_01_FULL_40_23]|nr:MAG: hypothetical protein A2716_00070 [candidate division WWE3 bacterium RIFCSPHIGHO2_01_FULL_40_23]
MNLEEFVRNAGYLGLFFIVFAESGLLFGFFLPGDSLLFTSGFLASQGIFDVIPLLSLLTVAAISGDSVGFWFGKRVGKRIFNREDSFFFHKKNLIAANNFYKKHGGKTIILARFIPAVRTFAPIVAGAAEMEYKSFAMYNVLGGILWVVGLGLGGYFLGKSIPDVDKYLIPIVILIVIISVSPGIIHVLKDSEHRKEIIFMFKKALNKVFNKNSQGDAE